MSVSNEEPATVRASVVLLDIRQCWHSGKIQVRTRNAGCNSNTPKKIEFKAHTGYIRKNANSSWDSTEL